MISNIDELKDFINWAKANGVKKLQINGAEIEFSDVAMIEKYAAIDDVKPEPLTTTKTLTDSEELDQREEEDLLYWSSR